MAGISTAASGALAVEARKPRVARLGFTKHAAEHHNARYELPRFEGTVAVANQYGP